ncbi:hypothetical protein F0267_01390 [Vibrio coralliilyticus]|uniref:Uncharacterized protein n=1 Tax=Vibrio coralliilyticus TaxID=190893 RepID=A0AAN0VZX4_9VIBR|nr:hypothetical protein [Vibrio coralliilyticus]AIW22323.1 hypothetical protein IX92_24960 [Vibrio coralliilyticus]NOH36877.1 hypothetical protein [Vibrio coralliilyticus]
MDMTVVNEAQKLTKLLDDLRLLESQFNSQLNKYAMDTSENDLKERQRNSVLESLTSSIASKKEEVKTQSQVVQNLIAKI